VLVVLTGALISSPAAGAAGEAAVVELRRGEAAVPERARAIVERVLESNGLAPIDPEEIALRLSKQLHKAPAVDARALAALEREAKELLEAVAFGRDDEALARSRAALRREASRLSAINQSDTAARALGDVCLFAVRALVHRSDGAGAREQARECLRLVPDLEPSSETHPPEVRTLIALARTEGRDAGKLGTLIVTATSFPNACELRLQGRPAGKLPAELELVPGAYAVQAACGGAPGFVRDVRVRAGGTERVVLAPRLESALRGELTGVLYADRNTGELGARDFATFSEWLSISELWTLERRGSRLLATRWRRNGGGAFARTELEESLEPAATFERRFELALASRVCETKGCIGTNRDAGGKPGAIGWQITGAVGVAAMLGSWAAFIRHQQLDADLSDLRSTDPRYSELVDQRDDFATIAIVATSAGSATFTVSAPFWLPERAATPWWAWSAGAIGTGAAGVGTALLARGDRFVRTACLPGDPPCLRRSPLLPLGSLLLTQGASLIAIPVTYIVRGALADETAIRVGISPSELAIGAQGAF